MEGLKVQLLIPSDGRKIINFTRAFSVAFHATKVERRGEEEDKCVIWGSFLVMFALVEYYH